MDHLTISALDIRFMADTLARMLIAVALTLPIAREREMHDVSAGLRTFPIVAVGACGLIILARSVLGAQSDTQTHVLQGLVTGIGFIGGGAIVKSNDRVHGTATAASVWSTAIIGAAVGYGQTEIAIVLAVVTFLTLRGVGVIEARQAPPPTTAATAAVPAVPSVPRSEPPAK
jgi:putative Mg2+ transporter-C (MgtC) family protein